MIFALLAATILMADSTTAMQVDPAPAATPAATAPDAKKAGDKLVCQKEAVIGTRLTTKKCRTAAQIAERRREDRANLEKMQQISNPENVR